MSLARLVVVEGPDVGCEFAVPLRGGGIGRGEDNIAQLSDLAVSRTHCTVELRDGQLALVDHKSRNRTLVNGKPVDVHILTESDEITIGKTRMIYLPAEGGPAIYEGRPSRVTMEIGSTEVLGARAAREGAGSDRACHYLGAIANLGNTLRVLTDRAAVGRAAAQATLNALGADRAFVVERDPGGRMAPTSACISPTDAEGAQLAISGDVVQSVVTTGKVLGVEAHFGAGATRLAIAAPLIDGAGSLFGLIYADRRVGPPPTHTDLMALGCIAHVISAALASVAGREVLQRENEVLTERAGGREFVGASEPAQAVLRFVRKVGPSAATVLLTGESGSGKEMVARAVHNASKRHRQGFVAVNCAALTESLIESELFGHEKGAFTGATERKLGRFETADKGTLFLDEVGELPLSCQTKFLRVLEEQTFERVGGTRPISVDVRVVAATNRHLPDMVARGEFREDLYYRLSVIHTEIPPLRARRGDIPTLAAHFLDKLKHQVPRRVGGFEQAAMTALCNHTWPGNVRELRNAIERALVLGDSDLVRAADLPPEMVASAHQAPPTAPFAAAMLSTVGASSGGIARTTPPIPVTPSVPRSLKELEREGILAALRATGGNKAQAAAILEIDRSTLYKKIKDYAIET